MMRHRAVETFGNIRPGFRNQATRHWQWLPLDHLHQQPPPAQSEHTNSAWSPGASSSHDRAHIGQLRHLFTRPKFPSTPHRQHPPCGTCQCQPHAAGACRSTHLGVLPVPPTALANCEARFAPATQRIPLRITSIWRQVGQYKPGCFMSRSPPGNQCAVQAALRRHKPRATTAPAHADLSDQRTQPPKRRRGRGTKRAALIDT